MFIFKMCDFIFISSCFFAVFKSLYCVSRKVLSHYFAFKPFVYLRLTYAPKASAVDDFEVISFAS